SEVTAPHLAIQSLRFVTPDVALVNAAGTQFGSAIVVRRTPLLLVVKKQPAGWRIASLRVLQDRGRIFVAWPRFPL
ncbi:MAG TPA: hypothetical protein VGS58_19940, partial [Candidatus Sulfopaludibacter sp.]|nr:hypothetical protein [Candidatus Sulfopaludibacter sp.]